MLNYIAIPGELDLCRLFSHVTKCRSPASAEATARISDSFLLFSEFGAQTFL